MSDLKILQGILLFKGVAASGDVTFTPHTNKGPTFDSFFYLIMKPQKIKQEK